MGTRDCGRTEGTAAMDGIFHFMGDRVCRMGRSSKRHAEPDYQAAAVTRLLTAFT
jgi:hypothetical protein